MRCDAVKKGNEMLTDSITDIQRTNLATTICPGKEIKTFNGFSPSKCPHHRSDVDAVP